MYLQSIERLAIAVYALYLAFGWGCDYYGAPTSITSGAPFAVLVS